MGQGIPTGLHRHEKAGLNSGLGDAKWTKQVLATSNGQSSAFLTGQCIRAD